MKKEKNVFKVKKFWAIFCSILFTIIVFNLMTIDYAASDLNAYIDTIEKVDYGNNQLTPVKEGNYYTFKKDTDLKVVQITDFHIGGGRYTVEEDKKAFYEVASMLQAEKPDLVIFTGDLIFACPGPVFNGGGTFNNMKAHKFVLKFMEKLGVYYSVTFGNHDTESFDYYSRHQIGELYESDEYPHCIFESNFSEENGSVTNQCIVCKNNSNVITKVLMLIDSNDYTSNSIMASINWEYDVIHDAQVTWAANTIKALSNNTAPYVESLFFFHIPIGEFETAYQQVLINADATRASEHDNNVTYIEGYWDEKISDSMGGRIWYGGCSNKDKTPADQDKLFETLADDMNSMKACFVGHDHVNCGVIDYYGVLLSYGYSIDNTAYTGIANYGLQRGCTVITIKNDGTFTQVHKNCYVDYPEISTTKFFTVDTTSQLYEGVYKGN